MSIPTITLKDIDLLDRICIVDDAPLEIPSILLEDFDIVKKETRGYVYTKPNVIDFYERMFPKMRVRPDDRFDERRLLDWLQRLRQKAKYQHHKHVLVLDLCCTKKQLTSMFIEKLVEVIHDFGEIIFVLTVPSGFKKHALFHKFDRVILGQHIQNDAPLWETLGEDVKEFYSNVSRGQRFLTWNVKDNRYEILDVNEHPPLTSGGATSNDKSNNKPKDTCDVSEKPKDSSTSSSTSSAKSSTKSSATSATSTSSSSSTSSASKTAAKNEAKALKKETKKNTKLNEKVDAPKETENKEEYENRDDCIIL